jgi:hypothetical protein
LHRGDVGADYFRVWVGLGNISGQGH